MPKLQLTKAFLSAASSSGDKSLGPTNVRSRQPTSFSMLLRNQSGLLSISSLIGSSESAGSWFLRGPKSL